MVNFNSSAILSNFLSNANFIILSPSYLPNNSKIMDLFVIVINYYYGSEYVGLWSNTIRIFNSLLIFLLGASLPFVLNIIKDKKTNSQKAKIFIYFWASFCPLIILSIFVASNWGEYILSFFMTYDFEVSNRSSNGVTEI